MNPPPLRIETADALLDELRVQAREAGARDDRCGYFAALYALMTERVCQGLEGGRFREPERLQALTCHFALRYLGALYRYRAGESTPESWRVAFDAGPTWRPIVLQHLLLGINAHINFDLGISAAQVSDASSLDDVEADFNEINAILAELLDDVQDRLGTISPWMRILDWVGGRQDEAIVNFSLRRAREAAWDVATRYVPLDADARLGAEADLDARIARFARVVLKPGRIISMAAVPIRLRERASVAEVIEALGVPAR